MASRTFDWLDAAVAKFARRQVVALAVVGFDGAGDVVLGQFDRQAVVGLAVRVIEGDANDVVDHV
jgi:hypothetical protein